MSATANTSKGGQFATARRGGMDAGEIAFVTEKRRNGVSDFAIAKMIGRALATVQAVPQLVAQEADCPAPKPFLTPRPRPSRMVTTPQHAAADHKRWRDTRPMPSRIKALVKAIADRHGVTSEGLTGDRKTAYVVYARQEAFAAIYAFKSIDGRAVYSLKTIGRWFGNRDHTTIRHGIAQHGLRLATAELLEAA